MRTRASAVEERLIRTTPYRRSSRIQRISETISVDGESRSGVAFDAVNEARYTVLSWRAIQL